MVSPKAQDGSRVSAASALLDRGWGKPEQKSEIDLTARRYVARLPEKAKTVEAWQQQHARMTDQTAH